MRAKRKGNRLLYFIDDQSKSSSYSTRVGIYGPQSGAYRAKDPIEEPPVSPTPFGPL